MYWSSRRFKILSWYSECVTEVMGLRERKKIETARRIVRTAIALFVERGFDNVSVRRSPTPPTSPR